VKEHLHYPNLINYSAHPLRSARLDIAVLALSEGVIATTSGPLHVANLFGKKSLWTNAVGFSGFPFLQNTFFVPKLWYEEINSRRKLISYKHMKVWPKKYFVESLELDDDSTVVEENTPEMLSSAFESVFFENLSVSKQESILFSRLAPSFQKNNFGWTL
jgi:putative glycosyltransferase (TIGR04372 family)